MTDDPVPEFIGGPLEHIKTLEARIAVLQAALAAVPELLAEARRLKAHKCVSQLVEEFSAETTAEY